MFVQFYINYMYLQFLLITVFINGILVSSDVNQSHSFAECYEQSFLFAAQLI